MISERGLARMLAISYTKIKKLRTEKEGPQYFRFGPRTVRYLRTDVDIWIAEKKNKGE